MATTYKSRDVDYGNGTQYVELVDGVVTDQWIQSNGNHHYTGNGNPDIVGKPESSLRGMGFRKLSHTGQRDMLEQRAY